MLVITSTTVQTRVIQRTGVKPLVLLGMALGVVGMLLFTQLTPTSSYGTGVLPGLLVIGVGMGCIFAPAFSAATLGVAPNEAGIASGMVNTSQQIGGSIGTSLLSTIYATAVASYFTSHPHVRGLPPPRRSTATRRHSGGPPGSSASGSARAGDPARPMRDPPGVGSGPPWPDTRSATATTTSPRNGAAVTDGPGSPEPALAP